jgi:predicted nucleic acid-binding protein
MREHPRVDNRLTTVDPTERVSICSVVRGEIQYGIQRLPPGKRREALEAKAAKLFAILPCEPVPPEAGDHYARVKVDRERQGLALDENDLWIAATTLALGGILVSRDSDFKGIQGLRVDDWTA